MLAAGAAFLALAFASRADFSGLDLARLFERPSDAAVAVTEPAPSTVDEG